MIKAIDTLAAILAFPSVALIWVSEGGKELAQVYFFIYLVFVYDSVFNLWNAFLEVDVEAV